MALILKIFKGVRITIRLPISIKTIVVVKIPDETPNTDTDRPYANIQKAILIILELIGFLLSQSSIKTGALSCARFEVL